MIPAPTLAAQPHPAAPESSLRGAEARQSVYRPLGALRLLLATFVFIVHTEQVMPLFAGYVNWAGLGVWMFFVVSGYVITSAYDNFYRGRVLAFLTNRAIRIYPTLWLCLLLSLGLIYLRSTMGLSLELPRLEGYGAREFVYGVTVVAGFLNDRIWLPLAPAATLTIEMKFYLAAAATFFAIDWLRIPVERGLFWAAMVFLAASVAVNVTGTQFRWFGALRYAPLFVIGGVFYFAARFGLAALGVRILLVPSLLLSIHFLLTGDSSTGYAGFGLDTRRIITGLLVLSLFVALNWLAQLSTSETFKKADRTLGDLTYPLYLVQIPMLAILLPMRSWDGPLDWFVLYLANVLAAFLVNWGFERRLLRIRRKIRGRVLPT